MKSAENAGLIIAAVILVITVAWCVKRDVLAEREDEKWHRVDYVIRKNGTVFTSGASVRKMKGNEDGFTVAAQILEEFFEKFMIPEGSKHTYEIDVYGAFPLDVMGSARG